MDFFADRVCRLEIRFAQNEKYEVMRNNGGGRIDFKSGVPEALFKRAGGRCSVPRCKNTTIGPFYHRAGAVNMGVACHIYSASEDGPRGRGGKDESFISSELNGIWCCEYHGTLIDKAKGADYPAHVLFAWKELAEARTRKQLNDMPSPLGWVESIAFIEFPVLDVLPKVVLSRNTILWGRGVCGKSSLLEAAASISNSKYADRFCETQVLAKGECHEEARMQAEVVYSTVDTFDKKVSLEIFGNNLVRREGVTSCLLPPGDLEVIFCSDSDYFRRSHEDDVDYLMRVLSVDKSTLFSLSKIGSKVLIPAEMKFLSREEEDEETGETYVKRKDDGDPCLDLHIRIFPRKQFLPFIALATSEKALLILDLLITKAREICKQRLTLLLVDGLASNFDGGNFERLLRALECEDFQSVVVLPPNREDDLIEIRDGVTCLKDAGYLKFWRLGLIGE